MVDGSHLRLSPPYRAVARPHCTATGRPARSGAAALWTARRYTCGSMDQVDAVVVGAGVVGLAVARQLALAGREVLILEAAARFGTGASARNSEVIHAGIYYPPGSLKAQLCVRGRERLYEFCAGRAIAHRRCEKLIVATTDAELPGLARVAATAQANGVELTRLDRAAAQALEPQLSCAAALHSPLTGIIDSQACMLALLGDAESRGASLACGSAVTRVVLTDEAVLIGDRKSTRLNSSHSQISYAVFCLK